MDYGVDYSFGRPNLDQLWNAGYRWVSRYLSWLPNSKVINKAELDALRARGFQVMLNWEYDARDQLGGASAGTAHAKEAVRQALALGYPAGCTIYFAADWDATEAQQTQINAYMSAAKVIVHAAGYRIGIYGGYYVVKRTLDAGHADDAWQAFAWSGGQWDDRAAIRQVQNGLKVGGADVDRNERRGTTFLMGQPSGGAAPMPSPAPAPQAPPPPVSASPSAPATIFGPGGWRPGMQWRYIAQRVLTNQWLDWEIPLQRDELTWDLSGPGALRGSISPEYPGLGQGPDGLPLLKEWSTILYAEADGIIRWGGIVVSLEFNEGGRLEVEAAGFTTYPTGFPTLNEIRGTNLDPAQVFKQIWDNGIQNQTGSNLGLTVDSISTPFRIGTADEPYEYVWWNSPDAGQELSNLASGRFDWVEEHTWAGTMAAPSVQHRVRLGFPRIGSRRSDLAFEQGVNIIVTPTAIRHGDDYANEIIGLGAGEGRARVLKRIAELEAGTLRRPYVYSDVAVTTASAFEPRLRTMLAGKKQTLTIEEITVVNHNHAPIGSWQVGDDILVQATIPWLGDVAIWHRIVAWSLAGEDRAVLKLQRSDSFIYGG